GLAEPEVGVLVEGDELAVGRGRGGGLASARDAAATFGLVLAFAAAPATAAEEAAAFRRVLRLADDRRLPRGHVIAMHLALVPILKRLAAVLPGDGQRAHLHRAGNLLAHALVLLVAGHRLETILRDAGQRQYYEQTG